MRRYAPSEAARAHPHAYYQAATIGSLSHSSTPCVCAAKETRRQLCRSLDATLHRPPPYTHLAHRCTGATRYRTDRAAKPQHGLALATQIIFQLRRTIHEKGDLDQVPPAHPEPNSPPIIRAIGEQIAGAVVASLATETILHHQITFQPLPAAGCTRLLQCAVTRLSSLHLAGQLHPSLAITALRELPPGATDQQQMRLLDWQAIAFAACPDNIYAETIACEQATLLAAKWYAKPASDGKLTVIIQDEWTTDDLLAHQRGWQRAQSPQQLSL